MAACVYSLVTVVTVWHVTMETMLRKNRTSRNCFKHASGHEAAALNVGVYNCIRDCFDSIWVCTK